MKKLLIIGLLVNICTTLSAQDTLSVEENINMLQYPSEGRCMVYITRRSSAAMLISFKIFDGDIFLGKLKANKYFAYECDPGEHVFIARSENTDYVDATLEANKIYVIDAQVKMGIVKAKVKMVPLDKKHKKYEKEKKKFFEFIEKKKGELLVTDDEEETEDEPEDETPNKLVKKFYDKKEKGDKLTMMTSDMYIDV
ncbi:MAG TPA: hypothetical protein DIT04_14090 [Dysgonomonas sp.]|nr:hypothetical protein [Dysgonomonas sp.]